MQGPDRQRRPQVANRLGGQPQAASGGSAFERPARAWPWTKGERWPRSEAADAQRGLELARAAVEPWGALGRGGRLERLLEAAEHLEARDVAGVLAPDLGLAPAELRGRLDAELFRFREALEILREGTQGTPPGQPGPAPGLFAAHWSDFAAGLGTRLAGRLIDGHPAVVWSDPALPSAAALLVECLEQAGLPAGTLGLLHDDLGLSLRWALEALESEPGAWARLKGPAAALKDFQRHPEQLSLWPLRNSTELVLEGQDPAERARDVALKAVGRSDTLSGQIPGQVGRVICHQRLFSRFSEELLHDLEAGPEGPLGAWVPAIDGDLPEYVRRAWALGLDEGATPIFGDEPLDRAAEAPLTAPSEERPAGRPPRVVPPVVFTNVEPHQRIARLRRPAPVVVLLRAPSEGAARELAAALNAVE